MNEKEKMLAGELYDGINEELVKDLYKVKDLCYEYNHIKPSQIEKRKEVMKKILGKHKEKFLIEQPFMCDLRL